MPSLLSNISIASGGRVITLVIGLFVTALTTRLLGVTQYGIFVAILSYATIFQVIADFGLYLFTTRILAREETSEVVSHVISLRMALLAINFAIGIIFAYVLSLFTYNISALVIISIALIAQSVSQFPLQVHQAKGNMWPAVIGDVVARSVQVGIIGVAFLGVGNSVNQLHIVVLAFLVSTASALGIHYVFLPIRSKLKITINVTAWKKIIKKSWPYALMLALNAVYFRVDTVMLAILHPGEDVGLYGIAYRIIESLLFFPAMFGGLLLPRITEALLKKDNKKASAWLNQGLHVTMVVAGVVGVIGFLYSSIAIKVLAGVQFLPAIILVNILLVALISMFIGNIFGYTLVALDKKMHLVWLDAGLVVFNIIANAITIPAYGAIAAASTTVATEILATLVAGWIIARSMSISPPFITITKVVLIAIATIIRSMIRPNNRGEILKAGIVGVFMVSLVVYMQALHKKDLALLISRQ